MTNEPLNNPVNDIIDINLSVTARKKFRIDGDNNRIIELNTSDMGIVGRMSTIYDKLKDLQQRASKLVDGVDPDNEDIEASIRSGSVMDERLKDIDREMRALIDELFDSEVSSKAAPDGSMYDPFNGSFRFEHIITTLAELYENNFKAEFDKMSKQVSKHTAKYTNKGN